MSAHITAINHRSRTTGSESYIRELETRGGVGTGGGEAIRIRHSNPALESGAPVEYGRAHLRRTLG
jgi:hypothetical protein